MEIEERKIGEAWIVRPLEKRIDAASAPDFKEIILGQISRGHDRIVLDLSGVDFVDSSGLGAMVSCLKRIGDKGDLVLFGLRDKVMSLFRLTRMDRVFQIFPSQEEAIRTLPGEIELSTVESEDYSDSEGYDVTIFDGFVPTNFQNSNTIIIDPDVDLPFAKLISHSDYPKIF